MWKNIEAAPADAILGLTEAFKNDDNTQKVNLGVGVYKDEQGNTFKDSQGKEIDGTPFSGTFAEISQQIAKIKQNQTILVSSAAGSVGSTVCQIAKILGCKVIASTGSDEKVEWLKKEIGVDHFHITMNIGYYLEDFLLDYPYKLLSIFIYVFLFKLFK